MKASGRPLITFEPAWDEDSIRIPRLFAFFFFPTPRKSTTRTATPELKAPKKTPFMKPFLFSLAAIAALSLSASAQSQLPVKLGKPAPAVIKSPDYQINGGPQKRTTFGSWLEVEVQYATSPEMIDELTFKYTILIQDKLLDGEVTYVNIPAARDHFAVMYVTPRALLRLTGGKPLTSANIENVWIQVTKQGQVLDQTNLPHLPGLILNKNETPFAPLYYDRYEAIKPK
jgi:hypothetical protein